MANAAIAIRPISSKADRKRFVDLPFRLYKNDPNWVPPLKGEALGLITPEKNGWFIHAKAQLFLAERDGKVVGRHVRAGVGLFGHASRFNSRWPLVNSIRLI